VPSPSDCLSFQLAHTGVVASARIQAAMTELGLRVRHGVVLAQLASGPVGQNALATAVEVDPSVLVALLNDLETDGLVARRREPTDRRRHVVELTDQGAKVWAEVAKRLGEAENELFGRLSAADRERLGELLAQVCAPRDDASC
jgi:DNA-binding MarR family transcriptional regulator